MVRVMMVRVMMVSISRVSDKTFRDALEVSSALIIALEEGYMPVAVERARAE
jgi:hypothetical protein